MNWLRRHNRCGFTLVELLAAIALLLTLTAALFAIFNQTSKTWVLAEARTDTFQNARLALDLIARELGSLMVATNAVSGKFIRLLEFDESGSGFTTGDTKLATTPPNDALFFVAAAGDSLGKDYVDLTEYGYFVVFARDDALTMRGGYYYLLRHQTRSTTSAEWDFLANPSDWWRTPGVSSTTKTPLVDNVLRFWVRFEYLDPSVVPEGTNVSDSWPPRPELATTAPRAIHLRLSVLDRRYAERLKALRPNGLSEGELRRVPYEIDNLTDGALKATLRENLRTFFRTVYPRQG